MFWAKSLEGLRAMIPVNLSDKIREPEQSAHIEQHLALASKIEPTVGVLNEEAVAATLCSSLQLCNGMAIIGQQATKKQIDTSPLTAINFSQPLVQVSMEYDIILENITIKILFKSRFKLGLKRSHKIGHMFKLKY